MIFDPFGDFDSQGYLRNVLGSKDILEVKSLEYASFQRNIDRALRGDNRPKLILCNRLSIQSSFKILLLVWLKISKLDY
jgi:hypothetical protein